MAKRGIVKGEARGSYNRRSAEPTTAAVIDEIYSQQTDTLSAAIVEAYKNCMLYGHDELVMGSELIAQGRYWHGN